MAIPNGYPPPQPIRTRKVDLFRIDDYAELDKYACSVSVFFDLICCHDNCVRSIAAAPLSRSFIAH